MESAIESAEKLFNYSKKVAKTHQAFLKAVAEKKGLDLQAFMSDSD